MARTSSRKSGSTKRGRKAPGRSEVATGLVDYSLPPEAMGEVLERYARQRATRGSPADTEAGGDERDGLRDVLALLRARTRHDFRYYRENMLLRRVRRRMALKQVDGWEAYLRVLRSQPAEVGALRRDLLIGVTSFFRDPEAFEALASGVLPELVARADADRPVRVWVPGCATGEEAYSIAVLLFEAFRSVDKPASIQVFATDVDEETLEKARAGVYPDSVASAVSLERLKRFFTRADSHHYRVSKQLRDSIVFAPQNLITDAPFSRLDLISCRNVLIYLEPETQDRIVSVLHFALNDDGFLLLGPSESLGRAKAFFEPVAKKWRLFHRIGPVQRDLVRIPVADGDARRAPVVLTGMPRRPPAGYSQVMQKLIAEEFAPASVLVNREFEILAVQGPVVNYLEFPAGALTDNLLAMLRQGLRLRVRGACRDAGRQGRPVTDSEARVRRNGRYVPCSVTVRPVTQPEEAAGLLLVVFQDRAEAAQERPGGLGAGEVSESLVEQLERDCARPARTCKARSRSSNAPTRSSRPPTRRSCR